MYILMDVRKLQVVGTETYTISLPKAWVHANSLKRHDAIAVDTVENDTLTVRPAKRTTKDPKSLRVRVEHPELIPELIVHCYMQNVTELRLVGEPLSFEALSSIRKTTGLLDGFEITHESPKEVVIAFLYNDITITLPRLEQRTVFLFESMVDALEREDQAALFEAEDTTDRLYYVGRRLLFACLRDHLLRAKNGIAHEEDLLFVQTQLRKMENFADVLKSLSGHGPDKTDIKTMKRIVGIVKSVILTQGKAVEVKRELDALKPTGANEHVRARVLRLTEIARDIYETAISIRFNDQKLDRI